MALTIHDVLSKIASAVRRLSNTTEKLSLNAINEHLDNVETQIWTLASIVDNNVTAMDASYFKGVSKIGYQAFRSSDILASVEIPANVRVIDEYAFSHCYNLGKVIIHAETICNNAFEECRWVNDVILGNEVSIIGEENFTNCGYINSVVLGENISNIPNGTFSYSWPTDDGEYSEARIKYLTLYRKEPPVINIKLHSYITKIIVPAGCLDAYKNADGWADYAYYMEEATDE